MMNYYYIIYTPLSRDSPKRRKYRSGLTPTSWNIANTATGSTADIKDENNSTSMLLNG